MEYLQPDAVLPNVYDPQSLNRYSFERRYPYKYVDENGNLAFLAPFLYYAAISAPIWAPAPYQYNLYQLNAASDDFSSNPSLSAGFWLLLAAYDANTPFPEGAAAKKISKTTAAKLTKEITIDPKSVRFTQNTISESFQDGKSVSETIDDLISGKLKQSQIPPIRVVEKEGKLFSLDNRRLYAFKEAGITKINAVLEDIKNSKILKEFSKKYTTINEGKSLNVNWR